MRKVIYVFLLFTIFLTSCAINHNVSFINGGIYYKNHKYYKSELICNANIINLTKVGYIYELYRFYFYSYTKDNPEIIVSKDGRSVYVREDIDYKDYDFYLVTSKGQKCTFKLNDLIKEEMTIEHKYEQSDSIYVFNDSSLKLGLEIKLFTNQNEYYIYMDGKLYTISALFKNFVEDCID